MNINIVTIALLLSSVCFTKAQDVRQFFTTHNTIAFDDATLRYEQEGRVLVGDVLTIEQSLQFGDSRFPVSTSDYSAAAKTIVSGGNWINVNQGSVLTIDENKGNFNMNSKGQKVTGQKAWDTNLASYGFESMKQIKSEFETLSDYLATLPMTGTFDSKDQNSYKIIGNGKDVSVVNITQEDLANARGLELSVPGKGLLIVNVSGKDPTFNANFIGSSGEYASNVLWNFADAESVTANRRVEGAGLAPNATGKFNDGYEGSWILNTLAYMGGEGHFRPLLGLTIPSIPVPKPEPEPTPPAPLPPTPEPPAPAPPTPAPVSQVPEGGPGILLLTILASGLGCLRRR